MGTTLRVHCSRLRVGLGLATIVFLNSFNVGPISPAMGFSIVKNSISQVFLEDNGDFICIATAISSHYVLTAARCLRNRIPQNVTVRPGTPDARLGGRIHQVDKIIIHENFNLGNDLGIPQNNIALANVTEPFRAEDNVRSMSLYHPGDFIEFTIGAEVLSYGCYRKSSGLLVSWIPTVDENACKIKYERSGGLANGEICVSSRELGECGGVSGDPLIVGGRLAAIYSYRANYCHDRRGDHCPVVYLGIPGYYKWIKKNAGL